MVDEAKLYSSIHSTFKALSVQCALGHCEKNWTPSVDQGWLQALEFLVHLIGLLSILFRCNGFTRI